ncbi:MAG: hypothetical protein ACYDEK_09780 [Vulcanimicrobiaceae bacterium]
MPRKKSIEKSAQDFQAAAGDIVAFASSIESESDEHISWVHDYAIIRLYREFESFILDCLVGAINNNTTVLTETTHVEFPKHLTYEVCEFIITGSGYFDFKGRDGLIKTLKKYVPADHYLLGIVKKAKHKPYIEKLCALRNFAAHNSDVAKKAVLVALGSKRIGSAGSWLKRQARLKDITDGLNALAAEVETEAPY